MSRKGENIYKRKDNRWEARYIKGYNRDGSPKYGYCYGKTYREAKQKATTAKSNLITGVPVSTASRKRRLSAYCDEWLIINRDRIKGSTFVKYGTILEKHIKPKLGGCLIQALSTVIVEQFSHALMFDEELSPKTVKDILTVLRSIIKYINKQYPGIMTVPDIVYPKIPKKEIRVLTPAEQTKLINFLLEDTDEYKFGVLLSLLTGMRIGEVCALKWENISLADKTVKINESMQRLKAFNGNSASKTQRLVSSPKSVSSNRVIPLTDFTAKLCEARRCDVSSAFVLTGRSDKYIEPRTLQYKLDKYTKECELEGVHFHTLRHTFATRCVEVDFEIKSLSEILGHSTPKITLERYVHSSIELKRNNMDKLAAIGF